MAVRAFCLLAVLGTARAAGDPGNATLLNKANFTQFLEAQHEQKRSALVMFHVSWCKACQRTFPTFAAASNSVVAAEVPVAFAHVDCTDEKALCQRFEVQGYPTIKFFHSEEGRAPQNFRGVRSIDGFLRYAKRMTSAPVRPMTRERLRQAMAPETFSALVVAQRHAERFAPVALRWMDRHVVASAEQLTDLLPEGSQSEGATLAVLSPEHQQWPGLSTARSGVAFYHGPLENESAVNDWIVAHRFPGLWRLHENNFYEFTHGDRPAVLLAYGVVTEGLEAEWRAAQQRHTEHYFFGAVNGSYWAEELKHFNIQPQELPRVLLAEQNFEVWVEDIFHLRAEELTRDLARLQAGEIHLLRQSRDIIAKLFFYKREASRLLNWSLENSHKPEAILTLVGFVLVGLLLFLALILLGTAFRDEAKKWD